MRDYGELVREAIAKAHKEAEAKTGRFEVGRRYSTRSVCDHNCIFSYEIIKRTEKTVTIADDFGRVKRCKIYNGSRAEYILPEGSFSMCPVLSAGA
jgi:hypothetical protein